MTRHTACLLGPGAFSSLRTWALGLHLAEPGTMEGSSAGFAQAAAALPLHSRCLWATSRQLDKGMASVDYRDDTLQKRLAWQQVLGGLHSGR